MIRSLALGLLLSARLLAAAEQAPLTRQTTSVDVLQNPSSDTVPSIVPPSKKGPFRNLFQGTISPPTPDIAAGLIEEVSATSKVICGLTMLQVDPNTDPKIRRDIVSAPAQQPNPNRQPDFKIRRVTPTVCRE